MFRQANIFAVLLFIAISSILVSDAASARTGGFSKVSPDNLIVLQTKLQNSNFQSVMGSKSSSMKVQSIDSAEQQVVAGMNYKIKATVSENGTQKKCCFFVEEGLPQKDGKQKFNVTCAQCGDQCDCKQN